MKEGESNVKKLVLLFICLGLAAVLPAQTQNPIEQGKNFFQLGSYREALALFRESLSDPRYINQRAEAYFWTSKTLFTLERYDEASRNFEFYLSEYPSDRNAPEAEYLRARIFYLNGEYESATLLLSRFVQTNPRSPFVPNAYYWAAESFYALGNLSEAERLFQVIVEQFPTSTRFEPARYRIDVLNLKYREEELLRLLQWTQEEAIKNAQNYLRQEATYRQAIEALQAQQGSSLTPAELESLRAQVANLETQLQTSQSRTQQLTAQNRELTQSLQNSRAELESLQRSQSVASAPTQTDESISRVLALLQLKEDALSLKEALLNQLLEAVQ